MELVLGGLVVGVGEGLVGVGGEAPLGVGELLGEGLEGLLLLGVRRLVREERGQHGLLLQVVHRICHPTISQK